MVGLPSERRSVVADPLAELEIPAAKGLSAVIEPIVPIAVSRFGGPVAVGSLEAYTLTVQQDGARSRVVIGERERSALHGEFRRQAEEFGHVVRVPGMPGRLRV